MKCWLVCVHPIVAFINGPHSNISNVQLQVQFVQLQIQLQKLLPLRANEKWMQVIVSDEGLRWNVCDRGFILTEGDYKLQAREEARLLAMADDDGVKPEGLAFVQ